LFCPSAGAEPVRKIPFSIGYYVKGITEVDEKDANAALKIWSQDIGAAYGFEVNAMLYDSLDHLVNDYLNKKVDFISMQTIDYLKYAPMLKVKPEMASQRSNKVSVKYLLIVSSDSDIKVLDNLRNKRLAVKKGNRLGLTFMDVELMKAKMPAADRFYAVIQEKTKENQAVLAVFFGQADACIVSDVSYAMMTELNPQMGRKLKVLAVSPELVEIVGFFQKDYPQSHKDKAIEGIMKGVKASKRANQMKLLLNTEGMSTIADHHLNSIRTLLAEYNRLKGTK
jgi:phosphonate transport system substrate-binding protein